MVFVIIGVNCLIGAAGVGALLSDMDMKRKIAVALSAILLEVILSVIGVHLCYPDVPEYYDSIMGYALHGGLNG